MNPRPKIFFAFLALFLIPLLLVAFFSYSAAQRAVDYSDPSAKTAQFSYNVNRLLDQDEDALTRLARTPELTNWLQSPTRNQDETLRRSLQRALEEVLNSETHFVAAAVFDQEKRQLFLAEARSNEIIFREKDFLPGQLNPDERSGKARGAVRSGVFLNSLRAGLQMSVPLTSETQTQIGVLVAEVDLDSLLRAAAEKASRETGNSPHDIIVTNDAGKIFYHPNPAFLHQSTDTVNVGKSLSAGIRISGLNLTAAVIRNSAAQPLLKRFGTSIVLSLLLATIAAYLLARAWEKRTSGIERVTEGVAAIARGNLDHRIEARSSDAIRPLSDNLNLMTAQLREQIARETEARQFQSFVRLSAMLTHDLKNAIEALSLIVSNMERHFDNEAFRADAMKSLNVATQNLRSLVNRLTNPVTTLSGEYKRPQPVDLVPLIESVIKLTGEPALSDQQIEMNLPERLPALVDAERIEKVVENLILNAVEAMGSEGGKLSVTAGEAGEGKVFFSVTDTGPGMSRDFIENHLYRPFATTKRRGVGLGLYTCREVVRANGGAIEVVSQEGAGTTFRVVLPSAAIDTI